MKRRKAVSRLLITVAIVFGLIALLIGVAVEPSLLTGATSSQTTTKSSQTFNSSQFLDSSYLEYLLSRPTEASPIGIASYGIYNYSGSLQSYSINTTEVVGEADISALSASTNWNYSTDQSYSTLACIQCAGLQMNVNVVVTTGHGNQVFWIQNYVPFSNTTAREVVDFHGLIFNSTTPKANVTLDSYGNGRNGELNGKTTYAFGSFLGPVSSYSLPLDLRLATSVEVYNGGIEIIMSDSPFGNGTFASDNDTFGIVHIPIRNVTSASIVVMPSLYPWGRVTGGYQSYDSDLVWAAYCCGQTTKFVEMNSSLSLQYLNSRNQLESYPSFYTFGYTGESATNLRVIPYHDGGQVVIGQSDNSFLEQVP